MNWIEFKSKRILWGRRWNPPNSSMRIPVKSIYLEDLPFLELPRWTYDQWLAAGKPRNTNPILNISTFTIRHPSHEHKHQIHSWGSPSFYDPEDPREIWNYEKHGITPDLHPDSTSPEAVELWGSTGGI